MERLPDDLSAPVMRGLQPRKRFYFSRDLEKIAILQAAYLVVVL
jgi:hypothetical protein